MPDPLNEVPLDHETGPNAHASRLSPSTSLKELGAILLRRRLLFLSVLCGLLLLCLLYCVVAPNQYEANAKISMATAPSSALSLDSAAPAVAASILSAPLQQETLANVFRSDQLAWRLITGLKLYQQTAFCGNFPSRFPDFRVEAPSVEAQSWLLERFQKKLHVETIPRTMLISIRFRSRDRALSAIVVNELIRTYENQENESRLQATLQASKWLETQLKDLKAREVLEQQRLATFQSQHGILSSPETLPNGQPGESQHNPALLEIDELGRQLVATTSDRILREAEYRAAELGNPESVIAADAHLQAESGNFATAVLQQIRARHSELDQEQAQLSIEHGPNYPRVVEIRGLLQDLDRQRQVEDAKLVNQFKSSWQTSVDREQLVRKSLDDLTAVAMKENQASAQYAVMRQEASSSHDVYLRVKEKLEESGLSAGIHSSTISVVDPARQPFKPVSPDVMLDLAITLFVGLWIAIGVTLLIESIHPTLHRSKYFLLLLAALVLATSASHAQVPTPSSSGLPAGVARPTQTPAVRNTPNPKESPMIWDNAGTPLPTNNLAQPGTALATPMAAPIATGDLLDISEFHTPEFHSQLRVSIAGTVTLPMVKEVQISGMDEQSAARAIEAALIAQGMLRHPQVTVMVLSYAGQDVSVLGEVARPGVYAYPLHHRLLDLISAASGVAPNAGRLVNIYHRSDPLAAHPVVLDPSGADTGVDHNPELAPGDTVEVSRAGLVYVVGDVVRPGGFAVDPAQGLTVVQALSLAWGTAQNASTGKAILIREQKGGRTMTTLDLKRMLHGQDPDQPIHDRDILYVPHSTAKELWNKTLEAALQSAVGVSLYAGLVYSQWHAISTTSTAITSSTGTTTGTNSGTTTGTSSGSTTGSSTGSSSGTTTGSGTGTTTGTSTGTSTGSSSGTTTGTSTGSSTGTSTGSSTGTSTGSTTTTTTTTTH